MVKQNQPLRPAVAGDADAFAPGAMSPPPLLTLELLGSVLGVVDEHVSVASQFPERLIVPRRTAFRVGRKNE